MEAQTVASTRFIIAILVIILQKWIDNLTLSLDSEIFGSNLLFFENFHGINNLCVIFLDHKDFPKSASPDDLYNFEIFLRDLRCWT
jgi:hypothetical protein